MGRTRTNLRQEVARQLGMPFISGTSSAGGATSITDAVNLARYVDDELVGFYVYLSGETDAQHRRITDNAQSTGVVTFIPSDALTDSTADYEILPFPADAIHDAINTALLLLYNESLLVRPFWMHGVTGSPIYNADFSYWTSSSALNGWTATTTTLSRQQGTGAKWISEQSARLGTANGDVSLVAPWTRFLADFANTSVRLHAWANGSAAGANRVAIFETGSSVANSGNHEGDSDWHVVSTSSVTLTAGETDITVRLERAAGNADFNLIWLEGGAFPDLHPFPVALIPHGPLEVYLTPLSVNTTNTRTNTMPSGARRVAGWDWFKYHDEALDVATGVLVWHKKPAAGQLMWLKCQGPLTLPTADTGVIEVTQAEGMLVAKAAALALLESNPGVTPQWRDRVARLQRDVETLARGLAANAEGVSLGPTW